MDADLSGATTSFPEALQEQGMLVLGSCSTFSGWTVQASWTLGQHQIASRNLLSAIVDSGVVRRRVAQATNQLETDMASGM